MIIETWRTVLTNSFQNLWSGVIAFVPNLVIAIIIFIIGWLIGALIGRVVSELIKSLKLDQALRRAGVEETLKRGGLNLNSGNFIGGLIKWFIVIAFLVASFDVLGLKQINLFLQEVVLGYLPQVIISVLILLVAAVIGDVMKKTVRASAAAAHVGHSRFLGQVTKWAIWIFAIIIALNQLGIAPAIIQTLFTGFVVAISLAVGLAFGLGGQEAAARLIEKTREEMVHKND
jgi:small-conductance mechanosensitive channel